MDLSFLDLRQKPLFMFSLKFRFSVLGREIKGKRIMRFEI